MINTESKFEIIACYRAPDSALTPSEWDTNINNSSDIN